MKLILEHNAKAISTLLLDFFILMCFFIYRELADVVKVISVHRDDFFALKNASGNWTRYLCNGLVFFHRNKCFC